MRTIIGQNIRALRLELGLSVKKYSELTGVSPTTIVNVEQGHKGLKIETVEKLIRYSDLTIEQVSSKSFVVPSNLRENLFEKFQDDLEKRRFFLYSPKILDAINKKLINSKFFQSFKEINQIVTFFESFGWEVRGTSLQNELKKHPQVSIEPHPTKKNTNVYRKK